MEEGTNEPVLATSEIGGDGDSMSAWRTGKTEELAASRGKIMALRIPLDPESVSAQLDLSPSAAHLSPLNKEVQLTMTRIRDSWLFSAGALTRNRDPSAVTSKSSMSSTWKSGRGSPALSPAPGEIGTAMTSPAGPM